MNSNSRLLLVGSLAATAVAAGAGAACAAQTAVSPSITPSVPVGHLTQMDVPVALTNATTYGIAPITHLKLDPLAGTGVDPLDNGVDTQGAGFKSVGTSTLTSPITDGDSLSTLPVVGNVVGMLP